MAVLVYKWLFIPLLAGQLALPGSFNPHPFHVSVTEVNHNAGDRTLEISCKLFTDDFEKVLIKNYPPDAVHKTKVDLIHPSNSSAMDTLVKKYLLQHLSINVNGKPVTFHYLGFENEAEAVYGYMEVNNVPDVTQLNISNKLLYDLYDDQISIIHIIVGGKRKSTKLNYPEKEASFVF